jgi:hypothetical protein
MYYIAIEDEFLMTRDGPTNVPQLKLMIRWKEGSCAERVGRHNIGARVR